MNVLVIGSGGREHALSWAISSSPLLDELYCAPGNAGIADVATCVEIGVNDFDGIIAFCKDKEIEFVVVGPEDPLVNGLVDRLDAEGIKSFGPNAAAAQLEGSKGFTKDLCADYNIPTAAYGRFADAREAKAYIEKHGAPIVVKADGLAAGKGVIMAETDEQAHAAIDEIFGGKFGGAGAELVIEEWLEGEEASFFALCDGTNAIPLATAQDHKRVGDGDTGLNTGGMGAYSPAPVITETMSLVVMDRIVRPTLAAMAEKGMPFKGVLFVGLMITKDGPKLIEFNVRFGDPECEVLMVRLMSDILPALIAAHDGTLDEIELEWNDEAALSVVMASKGYPEAYTKGSEIRNLDAAASDEGVEIFHAGTKAEGRTTTAVGGRVLAVTALGRSVGKAQEKAYAAVDKIDWPEGFCRRDIGYRAIARGK
ncbi:MAG: phosphoribosylamine--glycine ligase [Alphaproteobacteria bacterium]|mgnify:FL=1|nr:phosphoribosylamine--glycine ligase [Alphaproteobacteria bacterium]MBO6627891.1 phosphoribosylamine--glycine ligase [Alphaproteobacteria bacterium]MDF1625460.1 phosphoribosylamine--glycine ligase [Parvibaculaceae bacterium]